MSLTPAALRGLWSLTWLETKIFIREPLGLIGSIAIPVVLFVLLGDMMSDEVGSGAALARVYLNVDVPVLGAMLIAINAVLSLVTIIAIYREGGILKRLRATPLRPTTILAAHVLVKLLFTFVTLALMLLVGRRYYPVDLVVPWVGFSLALTLGTVSILSVGFLIASLVPTARFAQPIGSIILYPMLGLSGLFVPVSKFPAGLDVVAQVLPTTHAVSLLKAVLIGDALWAHPGDVAGLVVIFAVCTAISSRVFRWE